MMSCPNNLAWCGHSVVQEIMRRKSEGLAAISKQGPRRGSRLALVVEGGGMRGVYSGGALVAMEELGLTQVFDEVYGESAGATNSCYFLSGQASYGIRIYLEDLATIKFVNPFRVGKMLDLDYAIDKVVATIKPLDVDRVLRSPSELYLAVTNAVTGEPRLIDVKCEGIPLLTLLKASGALIPLYNRPILINGTPFVDGGIANPIPIRSAIERGCTHILVLLTHPPDFIARLTLFERLWLAPLCRAWTPEFRRAYFTEHVRRYNQARELAFGNAGYQDVSIAVIAPGSASPRLDRATMAPKKLTAAMEDARSRTHGVFQGTELAAVPNS